MKPLPKFLIEFGPLLAFFIGNWKGGVFWGTGVFMVAIAIALVVSWILTKKIAKVPLFSAIFVGIFGGLTIWLHDDTFIKVKVTLINVFFGVTLLGGLYFGKVFIKYVVGEAINLPQEAWRALTLRWGIFFLCVAVLNELIWRNVSTDMWVNFKVFGLLGLTLVFAVANAPFMAKHMIEEEASKPDVPSA
jgi:intracellular septation protein